MAQLLSQRPKSLTPVGYWSGTCSTLLPSYIHVHYRLHMNEAVVGCRSHSRMSEEVQWISDQVAFFGDPGESDETLKLTPQT